MSAPTVTRKFVRSLVRKSQKKLKSADAKYTSEELELLLGYVADLRKDILQEFLAEHSLKKGGNKAEVIARLQAAIVEGTFSYDVLIALLDRVEPWGKQHVYLYGKPLANVTDWKKPDWVRDLLKEHRVHKYLNRTVPLLLPPKLAISTILHDAARIRIVAVEKREAYEREEELDHDGKNTDGEEVQFRAYIHRISRGLIAFEWDFVKGEAFLQVTQLPTHAKYEDAVERFGKLVRDWLPFDTFPPLPIAHAIAEFHRLEEQGLGAVRSHRVELAAPDGRRLSGSSSSAQQPLPGNTDIDSALQSVRDNGGSGHHGNFFLEPDATDSTNPVAAGDEVHVLLLGNRHRINIMTPQTEEVVRYALRRIREAC